jgi:transposase
MTFPLGKRSTTLTVCGGCKATLRELLRQRESREATPGAGIIDSQSVKSTEAGGPRGDDGGKKVNGRKRHLLVDTLGLVMAVKVHEADIQDRAGAVLRLWDLPNNFPRMKHLWADARYTGKLAADIKTHLGWTLEIVKHPWSGWQGTWAQKDAPLRALANLAPSAQIIGPLALILIGLFFCQSRAEISVGLQASPLSLFGPSSSDFLL